ncbi:MAG: aldehyde dehydrogenase family protein [Actinomycetota bacterium]|nr:aldehyde dehydrogenase family protein [Actinomycetota bacterium]
MTEPAPLEVRKTYKLYVGGAFPRTESGRTFPVHGPDGRLLAHACQASRKDVRDAVKAAAGAQASWAARTPYNRAQILYRVAEMLDGRRDQFAAELGAAGVADPRAEVLAAVDRWVWYAGWADKLAMILGSVNPVAGPYLDVSWPEPTGVVGVICPDDAPLLALVSRVAPAIVLGNTTVVVASEKAPLPAISFGEVLATSDLPGGVVNVLTGFRDELIGPMSSHEALGAIDLSGASADQRRIAEEGAAESLTRVIVPRPGETDWRSDRAQSPYIIADSCETKTFWHPVGV